ncbi:unnamed protein product, partial [Oppiella nova]
LIIGTPIYQSNVDKWSYDWHKYPGIPYTFKVEDPLIPVGDDVQELTNRYWHYSIYLSVAYIIVIFGIKHLMSYRKTGYDLRRYLTAWNCFHTGITPSTYPSPIL